MTYIDTDINAQNNNQIIWVNLVDIIGLVLPLPVDCDGCPMESFNDTDIINWVRSNNIDLNNWTGE